MGEIIDHNCGLCVASTLHDVYSFGEALQHRGREATGIVAKGPDRIDVAKWVGPISKFRVRDLYKIFPGHNYNMFMLHVRYATQGRKEAEKILEDAHPHTLGGKFYNRGSHTLTLGCDAVAIHNGQVDTGSSVFDCIDKKNLKTGCDTEALLHLFLKKGEGEILKKVDKSYTVAFAEKGKNRIVVLRDRSGMKPGVLYWKDGRYGVASEDIAPRKNGGEFIEDLQPGAAYYLYPDYKRPKPVKFVEPNLAYCFFEWNYIAHVDSVLNGLSVRSIREALGEALSREFDFGNADFVSFVPSCPEVAARNYARVLDLDFKPLFYKMRNERSFMGSTFKERASSINENLYLIPFLEDEFNNHPRDFCDIVEFPFQEDPFEDEFYGSSFEGKEGVIVDDSFVRGNVLKRVHNIFKNIKVKKLHILSYTPPIGIIGEDGVPRGCSCGVDMPPDDDFLARGDGRNKTEEEINENYGDRIQVHYLSLEGMLEAYEKLGMSRENLDTYCIGGKLHC